MFKVKDLVLNFGTSRYICTKYLRRLSGGTRTPRPPPPPRAGACVSPAGRVSLSRCRDGVSSEAPQCSVKP